MTYRQKRVLLEDRLTLSMICTAALGSPGLIAALWLGDGELWIKVFFTMFIVICFLLIVRFNVRIFIPEDDEE